LSEFIAIHLVTNSCASADDVKGCAVRTLDVPVDLLYF